MEAALQTEVWLHGDQLNTLFPQTAAMKGGKDSRFHQPVKTDRKVYLKNLNHKSIYRRKTSIV